MRKILLTIFIVLLLLGAIAAYLAWDHIYKPNVNLEKGSSAILLVPTGAKFETVKDSLYSRNLIKSHRTFEFLAGWKHYTDKVRPGRYRIKAGMSNNDLINMLRAGKQEAVKLTFNNIRTKADLAGKISKKIEPDSLSLLNILNDQTIISNYGLSTETVLAMFIPNTYEMYWNITAKDFLDRMDKEYKSFWTPARLSKAQETGLSPVEVSILASIVEQESHIDSEKPIIAGVYMNRLHRNIKLEADPTLIWAWNDFSIHRVLNKHKQLNSRYNTYMYAGLPPGPICIPSVASIDAVLNYQHHNFIYFCAKEDLSGYSNFACTLQEHMKNAAKYQQELNRRNIKQ